MLATPFARLTAAATVVLCMSTTTAHADINASPAEARATMRHYGQCLVNTPAGELTHAAVLVLLTRPDGTLTAKETQRLRVPECLDRKDTAFDYDTQLSFAEPLLRGAIFRALYFGPLKPQVRSWATANAIAPAWSSGGDARAALQKFGGCVVNADPATAERALKAAPVSADEGNAYQDLAPALGRCVAEGVALQLSKSVLEGILAEALYRRSVMATAAVTTAIPSTGAR